MPIPPFSKEEIIKAIKEVSKTGWPKSREGTDYELFYEGKGYPQKYIIDVANRIKTGKPYDNFNATEARIFLEKLGFVIRKKEREEKEHPFKLEEEKAIVSSKNTILYGPPGTGKTYKTKKYAVEVIEEWIKN